MLVFVVASDVAFVVDNAGEDAEDDDHEVSVLVLVIWDLVVVRLELELVEALWDLVVVRLELVRVPLELVVVLWDLVVVLTEMETEDLKSSDVDDDFSLARTICVVTGPDASCSEK